LSEREPARDSPTFQLFHERRADSISYAGLAGHLRRPPALPCPPN